jgi:hypothetical protein
VAGLHNQPGQADAKLLQQNPCALIRVGHQIDADPLCEALWPSKEIDEFTFTFVFKPSFKMKNYFNSAACRHRRCCVFATPRENVDFLQKKLALSHSGHYYSACTAFLSTKP